jgi:propanol-preferring alcohol dehydrogenase
LGASAVQLAKVFGALDLFAVDIRLDKLSWAEAFGAIPVDATAGDPVAQIMRLTEGRGVDVALELVGLAETAHQAVASLAIHGRAVLAGLTDQEFALNAYREVILKEAQVIGCSDHLLQELPLLIDLVRSGALDLSSVITRRVGLDAAAVNSALDGLEQFGPDVRTVIIP